MNGINKVILFGTVGTDPEIRILNENKRVSSFSMATNETFTDKNGTKQEITEWHNIEAWGFLADTISKYVKKGNHLIVEGKIKTDIYEDKDGSGKKNYRTKIVISQLNFVPSSKRDDNQQQQNQPVQNQPVQQQQNRPVQNQPVQNQPVQQQQNRPVQNQPVQNQPVQNQPVQNQPVQNQNFQQANQNASNYVSDEQFIENMSGNSDDFPF